MPEPIKDLRVLVTTCNSYRWCIAPFAHMFNKYWSDQQEVVVGGFAPPKEKMPDNFSFVQIQKKDLPRDKRSDGMIKFFGHKRVPDEFFIFMLEDFWLVHEVDVDGIKLLYDYMREHKDVLRADLTRDRSKIGEPLVKLGHLDVLESPKRAPYQWSHQGGIWNKKIMLHYLRPGEGGKGVPIENRCTGRLYQDGDRAPRVLGTRNWPLRYAHVCWKGDPRPRHLRLNHDPPVPAQDIQELRDLGYI